MMVTEKNYRDSRPCTILLEDQSRRSYKRKVICTAFYNNTNDPRAFFFLFEKILENRFNIFDESL